MRKKDKRKRKKHKRKLALDFNTEVRQSLHNSNKHTRTHDWTCCQGDKRQLSPALPRRVSHSDVIGCRQHRAGPWPIGQRHRRAQPALVCFFLSFFLSTLSILFFHQVLSLACPLVFLPLFLFDLFNSVSRRPQKLKL